MTGLLDPAIKAREMRVLGRECDQGQPHKERPHVQEYPHQHGPVLGRHEGWIGLILQERGARRRSRGRCRAAHA